MSKASVYFTLSKVDGNRDAKELKRELGAFRGVNSVSVNESDDWVAVDFDTTGVHVDSFERKLQALGYRIEEQKFENHIM